LAVRGTLSPTGPWRPAVVARLPRTLGLAPSLMRASSSLLRLVSTCVTPNVLALIAGCAATSYVQVAKESIGQATMLKDRTVQLMLRAEGPRGSVGDALVVLRPGDKNYEATLSHIGSLEPGESKSVPPWPTTR
jgi:hypothetical protein